MTWIANLTANKLTVGSSDKPAGITMFDEVTGAAFCVRVRNGNLDTAQGTCEDVQSGEVKTETTGEPVTSGGDDTPAPTPETGTSTPETETSTTTATTTESIGEQPTITLNGDATASLLVGETYTEKGATAEDAEDGPLPYKILVNQVEVSDIVLDTKSENTFTLTYETIDSDGNSASVERLIFVVAPEEIATSTLPIEEGEEASQEEEVSEESTEESTENEPAEEEQVEETDEEVVQEPATEDESIQETTSEEPSAEPEPATPVE